MRGSWGAGAFRMNYEGAINSMMRRMRETQSEDMRQYYQKFLSNRPCSACGGRRIRPEALGVQDRRTATSPRSRRCRVDDAVTPSSTSWTSRAPRPRSRPSC